MTTYRIQAPDGKTYQIEGPPGATDADVAQAVIAQFPQAGQAPTESVFRQVADVPVGIGKGIVQGVRMVADAFGASSDTSKKIKGVEDYIGSLMSAQSKKDSAEIGRIMKDAEDKGVADQVVAALKAFSVAPVDTLTTALGTAAPAIATGLLTTLTGGAPLLAGAATIGTGALMGAGTIKGTIYEETKNALVRAGVDPAEAEAKATKAQEYGGKNLDMILAGTALGAVAGGGPLEKGAAKILASSILKRSAAKEGAEIAATQAAKSSGRLASAVKEGVPEFVQAAQEKIAENVAQQREGLDVPTMRGVVGAGTLEGVAGAGLGAAVHRGEVPNAPPTVAPDQESEIDKLKAAAEVKRAEAEAKRAEAEAKRAEAEAAKAAETPAVEPAAETPAVETPTTEAPAVEPTTEAATIEEPKVRKAAEAPVEAGTPAVGFTEQQLLDLGFTKKQAIFKRLLGKELSDPAVVEDINTYLTKGYGPKGEAGSAHRLKLGELIAKPEAPSTTPAVEIPQVTEAPRVEDAKAEPEAGGAGVPVAGEPSAGPTAEGAGVTESVRVVPPVEDVGAPAGGEGQPSVAVKQKPATVSFRNPDSGVVYNESVTGALRRITEDDDIALEYPQREGAIMLTGIDRQAGGQKGRASDVLKALTTWADANNERLVLMPSASGDLKQPELIKWYERNGFTQSADGAMERAPTGGEGQPSVAVTETASGRHTAESDALHAEIKDLQTQQMALLTKAGRVPAPKSKARVQYDALGEQIEAKKQQWDEMTRKAAPITEQAPAETAAPQRSAMEVVTQGVDKVKPATPSADLDAWTAQRGDLTSQRDRLRDDIKDLTDSQKALKTRGGKVLPERQAAYDEAQRQIDELKAQQDAIKQQLAEHDKAKPKAEKPEKVEPMKATDRGLHALGTDTKTVFSDIEQEVIQAVGRYNNPEAKDVDRKLAISYLIDAARNGDVPEKAQNMARRALKNAIDRNDVPVRERARYDELTKDVSEEDETAWGSYRYGKDAKPSTAKNKYTADELAKEIKGFIRADVLGRKLVIVDSVFDLLASSDHTRRLVGAELFREGAYGVASNGVAYLVADRIRKGTGRAKFMHEMGVHVGLENLLPKTVYNKLTRQVDEWVKVDDGSQESEIARDAARRVAEAGTKEEDRHAEMLAYFVEAAMERGIDPTAEVTQGSKGLREWFRTLWAAFKVAVRRLGLKPETLNAQDVVNLAFGAARLEIAGTWHGTAAAFRRFDHKFMNTGEGAQAYGWGTYLAQRFGIARGYWVDDVRRKTTAGKVEATYMGKPLDSHGRDLGFVLAQIATAFHNMGNMNRAYSLIKSSAITDVARREKTVEAAKRANSKALPDLLDSLDALRRQLRVIESVDLSKLEVVDTPGVKPDGSLMRVDVAVADDEFLDWDKPLTEQSAKVRSALQKAGRTYGSNDASASGRDLYEDLTAEFGDDAEAVSKYLDSIGVKGVKFLDARSRGTATSGVRFDGKEYDRDELRDGLRAASEAKDWDRVAAFAVLSDVLNDGVDVTLSDLEGRIRDLESQFLDISKNSAERFGVQWNETKARQKATADALATPQGRRLLWLRQNKDGIEQIQRPKTRNLVVFDDKNIFRVGAQVAADKQRMRFGKDVLTPEAEAAAGKLDVVGEQERPGKLDFLKGNLALKTRILGVDNMAGLDATFAKLYDGVRSKAGWLNPMVLMSRARDYQRFAKAVREMGGLHREQELIVPMELHNSEGRAVNYNGVLRDIGDEAKRTGKSFDSLLNVVDQLVYAHREYNLRERNREIEKQIADLEAIDPVKHAKKIESLRDSIITLKIKDDAKLDAAEQAFQNDEFVKRVSGDLDTIRFNLIDMLVEAGRISADKAQDWKDATGYIPFQRLEEFQESLDSGGSFDKGITAMRNIRKLEGSERKVSSPVMGFSDLITWATKEAMFNDAAISALEDLELVGAAKKMDDKPFRDSPGDVVKNVYKNGEPVKYYVADPLLYAGFTLKTKELTRALKLLQGASRLLRAGVTSLPPFAIKQVADDITRAYTLSGVKNAKGMTADIIKSFGKDWYTEVAKRQKSAALKDLSKHGLMTTFGFHEEVKVKNLLKEAGVAKEGLGSAILRVMEAGAKASDEAVRQGIFNAVLEQTKSEKFPKGDVAMAEAAAREIINFSRQGSSETVQRLATGIPFFNAWAQGLDKLATAAAGRYVGDRGVSRGAARSMFYKRMAALTAVGVVYALMMQDDDEYQRLPDYVRDTNWILPGVKIAGSPVGIPIPGDLAFIFKAIPERVVRYMKTQGTKDEQAALSVVGELVKRGVDVFSSPNITPQVLRPLMENLTNYSWFLGRPLESQSQLQQRPYLREGSGTSDAMKVVARWLDDAAVNTGVEAFAVSPIKLENAIRGMFGTSAGLALSMADAMINPSRTDRPANRQVATQLLGASTFLKDPVGSRYLDLAYDLEKDVTQAANAYKTSITKYPGEAAEAVQKYKGLMTIQPAVNSIMEQVRNIEKQAKLIDADKTMPQDERRRRINDLRYLENTVAREAIRLRTHAMRVQQGLVK